MPGDRVVLLEGVSDVAAVGVLARARGIDLERVRLVDMAGVTNVRRRLAEARADDPDAEVLGLCDAAEARFVVRALAATGAHVRDVSDLGSYGFFVCEADLEDELIRALGTATVMRVLDDLGLAHKISQLQQQPAWRDRPLAEQLHRFAGIASGRKELLAGALAAAVTPGEEPEPLALLLDRLG